MRRPGRGQQAKNRQAMQEHATIASADKVRWKIYEGELLGGDKGAGFVPDMWGAFCIPMDVWYEREEVGKNEFLELVDDSYTFLRFHEAFVKHAYNPDEWDVEALPKEANPLFGTPVRKQPPVRDTLGVVPVGDAGYTMSETLKSRIDKLKNFTTKQPEGKKYTRKGDTWFGRFLERAKGGFGIFDSDDSAEPLLDATRETININSGSIKTAARPRDLVMAGKKQNALSETTPSTAVIPIQQWQPWTDEIIVGAAILAAIMKYFSANNPNQKSIVSTSRVSNPTVYVDLDQLRKEQQTGGE